jgi:agmatinase
MKNFAGIDKQFAAYETAEILLQSIPYDGTSTWIKGANKGFLAFLEAAENMELYDIETDSEVYKKGIHILKEITENSSPEKVFEEVYQQTQQLLSSNKFLTFFGGEHSISIGIIKAFYEKYNDLTVLQLDAHADLRPTYMNSSFNHACALHDANKNTNLIQVGIRSMDVSEKKFMNESNVFFAEKMFNNKSWMENSISKMTDDVYITLDLDVFDPSILPATGTPEPGGILWNDMLNYLNKVFTSKNVVGFDIVELAPIKDQLASNFLAAKLYYKMLSYKFKNS